MCKLTIMAGSEDSLIQKMNEHEDSEFHQSALKSRTAPIYPERQIVKER